MKDNNCKNHYKFIISDYELNALEVIKEHLMQPGQSKLGLLACDVIDSVISKSEKITDEKICGDTSGINVDMLGDAVTKMAEIFKLQNDYKEIRFIEDRVIYITCATQERTEMEITKYYDKPCFECRFLPITLITPCEH